VHRLNDGGYEVLIYRVRAGPGPRAQVGPAERP
jgi:hypothetical protein